MARLRHVPQDRVLRNWRRLLLSALNPNSSSSSSSSSPSPAGLSVPESAPASFDPHSNIHSIIDVANEIQNENAKVSSILYGYAYSLSQSLDPKNEGRGVLQFKTGLMAVIKRNQARKDGTTSDHNHDIEILRDFYRKQKERLAESEELQDRHKVFTTLSVLKDVIYALAENCPTNVAEKLLSPEFKKEMELDAQNSKAFQPYNILPLETPDISHTILNVPEIKAARLAIQYPRLQFASNFEPPHLRKPDVFDALEFAFGFQTDNVRNQREHLVLLLANAQSQMGDGSFISGTDLELDEDVINKFCNKMLSNYEKWCIYIRKPSVYAWATTKKNRVALVALYLCIWGEAANVRFLPEGICYIYHQMANELSGMLDNNKIEQSEKYCSQEKPSFLETVIKPIYNALKAETTKNAGGKAGHSKWRNYDDFNEFFWSSSCFKKLEWPLSSKQDSPFFSKTVNEKGGKRHSLGKTSFVEHRTFLHLYHSFLRVWILLVLMFQALTIIAFRGNLNMQTVKILCSLGLTYFVMKFIESVLDVILMVGAYKSSRKKAVNRIFIQLLFFGAYSGGLLFLYIKMMPGGDTFFRLYLLVLGVYVALQLFVSVILHIPFLRRWAGGGDKFTAVEVLKWLFREHYFVGRGLFESPMDYIRYASFWLVVLVSKFSFSYFLQIKPLVAATNSIKLYNGEIIYRWHDFFSKNNNNMLTIFFLWAPVVLIYLLDISIWYTVWSAFLGGLIGARDRLGEIRALSMLRDRFETFPEAFVKSLTSNPHKQGTAEMKVSIGSVVISQVNNYIISLKRTQSGSKTFVGVEINCKISILLSF